MSNKALNSNEVMPSNPADAAGTAPVRRRVPMATARRKLEVIQEIPGYHLHWFAEEKVSQALQGGYEFVDRNEITHLNNHNPGGGDGNTALDSRVSLIGGRTEFGVPFRATLMKIKQEFFDEDQKSLEQITIDKIKAIFNKEQILTRDGRMRTDANVYVKTAVFNRPIRKARIGRVV
jgi:hypothetical protein